MLSLFLLFTVLSFAASNSVDRFYSKEAPYIKVDTEDNEVVEAARDAAKSLTLYLNRGYLIKVVEIESAMKQKVEDTTNYKLQVTFGLTNCKRGEVDFENIDGCKVTDPSDPGSCGVILRKGENNNYVLFKENCDLDIPPLH